jgi:hypothetical protein
MGKKLAETLKEKLPALLEKYLRASGPQPNLATDTNCRKTE